MSVARTHCIRCGECCRRSSPSLQAVDLHLLEGRKIPRAALFTLRKGEAVWDNIQGRLVALDSEMIKVRETRQGACHFYDDAAKACTIYALRPAQCSALKCWDPAEFADLFKGPKLTRSDILPPGTLLELVKEHERRCSYDLLESLARRIQEEGEGPVRKILEILRFDFQLRPFVSKKLGIAREEMDFVFGRPLIRTVSMFGLKVIRKTDGTFFLTMHG